MQTFNSELIYESYAYPKGLRRIENLQETAIAASWNNASKSLADVTLKEKVRRNRRNKMSNLYNYKKMFK